MMEITDVRIRSVKPEGKLRAFASITLDNCLAIHNLKVIEGEKGLFVAMPSRKTNKGEFKDVVHPTNNDLRAKLEQTVVKAYEKALAEGEFSTEEEEESVSASVSASSAPAPRSTVDEEPAPRRSEPVFTPPPAPRVEAAPAPEPQPAPKQESEPEKKEEKKSSGGFFFRSIMGGK